MLTMSLALLEWFPPDMWFRLEPLARPEKLHS